MKIQYFFFAICVIVAQSVAAQMYKPTLEYTFDGYYFPYNMKEYSPHQEDDACFYPLMININGNHLDFAIYNEDYSVREKVDCKIDVPAGYRLYSVNVAGNMVLPDGTGFFIATFMKDDGYTQRGTADYAIAKAYGFAQGTPLLFDVASSTFMTSVLNSLYEINGKVSVMVVNQEWDKTTNETFYKTHVYSLGNASSSSVADVALDVSQRYLVKTYDMTGRLVDADTMGVPVITRYSDGSTSKTVR